MQIEELQEQWRRLDQKLDQSLALETEIVRGLVMQPARRRVNRLAVFPAIDVVFSVGGLLFCGAFLGDHWRDARLAAPAGAVMIGFLALLVDSIRQLERVAGLDWCGPVAEIQSSLQRLRVARIRQFKWIMLLSPLLGFCGLMVGAHGLLDWLSDGRVDIIDKLDSRWIVANVAFGLLFVPLGFLTARALAARCQGHPWWHSLLDGIAGNSLKAASRDVERWASLKREGSTQGG